MKNAHRTFLRISLLVLTALMILSVFPACSDPTVGPEQTTEATQANTDPAETTLPEYIAPTLEFPDNEINILVWSEAEDMTFVDNVTINEIQLEAYKRNKKVEDQFKIKLNYYIDPAVSGNLNLNDAYFKRIEASVESSDKEFDLFGGYAFLQTSYAINHPGYFHNLTDNEYLDFSNSWWPQDFLEVAKIGEKLYVANGMIEPNYYGRAAVIYYNKTLAAEYPDIPNLYELVDSGAWTLEKLFEYSSLALIDGNSDGKIGLSGINSDSSGLDTADRIGAAFNNNAPMDAFAISSDIVTYGFDSNGLPSAIDIPEKLIDLYKTLKSEMEDGSLLHYKTSDFDGGSDKVENHFINGSVLFFGNLAKTANRFRDMTDDYGFLPYPKYNSEQSDYKTFHALDNVTVFCVPTTVDLDAPAAVLEAMAYYGNKDIRPVYMERMLKTRSVRDAESIRMIDLIFDKISYEFTWVYSECFGNQQAPSMALRMAYKENRDISVNWKVLSKKFKSTFDKIAETMK